MTVCASGDPHGQQHGGLLVTTSLVRARPVGRPKSGLFIFAAIVLALSACSSSGTSEGGASPDTEETDSGGMTESDSGEASADFLAEANDRMEEWYVGTNRALPTSSPTPTAGKDVWVISCGEAAEGCARPAAGFKDAGELLGWNVTVVDGELNPEVWNTGIRQAIAAGADAIALDVVDCVAVSGALAEAKEAGIPIVGVYSFDCDDAGGEAMFDGMITYDRPFVEWIAQSGEMRADWLISQTNGEAKAIVFTNDQLIAVKHVMDGFTPRFETCTTCEVVELHDFVIADLGAPLQQTAETLILQYPEANAVVAPYDSSITLSIGPAVLASGRNADLVVTGQEGFATNIEFIRNDLGQDFSVGLDSNWTGWAGVDALNRIFAGEPQVDCGMGFQAIDIDHNMPAAGEPMRAAADYEANYRQIWGIDS